MGTPCQISGCKNEAPQAIAEQRLCVLHFTLSLEASCAEMRRETALGNAPQDRQRDIMRFITEKGGRLARVATSGLHLTDDLKENGRASGRGRGEISVGAGSLKKKKRRRT